MATWALLGACQGFLQTIQLMTDEAESHNSNLFFYIVQLIVFHHSFFFPPKALPRSSATQNNANSRGNTLAHIHSIPLGYTVSMTAIVQNCKARLANSDLPMRCFDTKNMLRHPVCVGEVCQDNRTNRTGLIIYHIYDC